MSSQEAGTVNPRALQRPPGSQADPLETSQAHGDAVHPNAEGAQLNAALTSQHINPLFLRKPGRPRPRPPPPEPTRGSAKRQWPRIWNWFADENGRDEVVQTDRMGRPAIEKDHNSGRMCVRVYPIQRLNQDLRNDPSIPEEGRLVGFQSDPEAGLPRPGTFRDSRPVPVGDWRTYKVRCDDNEILSPYVAKKNVGFDLLSLTDRKKGSAFVGWDREGYPAWSAFTRYQGPSFKTRDKKILSSSKERTNYLVDQQATREDDSIGHDMITFSSVKSGSLKAMLFIPHYNLTPPGNLRAVFTALGSPPDHHADLWAPYCLVEDEGELLPQEGSSEGLRFPNHSLQKSYQDEIAAMKRCFSLQRPITPLTRVTPLDTPNRQVKGTFFCSENKDGQVVDFDEDPHPSITNPEREEMLPNPKLRDEANRMLLGKAAFQLPVPLLSTLEFPPDMVQAVSTWLARDSIRSFGITFHGALWASFVWLVIWSDALFAVELGLWNRLSKDQQEKAHETAARRDQQGYGGWSGMRVICGIQTPDLTTFVLTFDIYLRYCVEHKLTAFAHPGLLIPLLRPSVKVEPICSDTSMQRWWQGTRSTLDFQPLWCFHLTCPAMLPNSGMACFTDTEQRDAPFIHALCGIMPIDYYGRPLRSFSMGAQFHMRAMPDHVKPLFSLPDPIKEGERIDLKPENSGRFLSQGYEDLTQGEIYPTPAWGQNRHSYPPYWTSLCTTGYQPIQERYDIITGRNLRAAPGAEKIIAEFKKRQAEEEAISNDHPRKRRKIAKAKKGPRCDSSFYAHAGYDDPIDLDTVPNSLRPEAERMNNIRRRSRALLKSNLPSTPGGQLFAEHIHPSVMEGLMRGVNKLLNKAGSSIMFDGRNVAHTPDESFTLTLSDCERYSEGASSDGESEYEVVVQEAVTRPKLLSLQEATEKFIAYLGQLSGERLTTTVWMELQACLSDLLETGHLVSKPAESKFQVHGMIKTALDLCAETQDPLKWVLHIPGPTSRPRQVVTSILSKDASKHAMIQVGVSCKNPILKGDLTTRAHHMKSAPYSGPKHSQAIRLWQTVSDMLEHLASCEPTYLKAKETMARDPEALANWAEDYQQDINKAASHFQQFCDVVRGAGEPGALAKEIQHRSKDLKLLLLPEELEASPEVPAESDDPGANQGDSVEKVIASGGRYESPPLPEPPRLPPSPAPRPPPTTGPPTGSHMQSNPGNSQAGPQPSLAASTGDGDESSHVQTPAPVLDPKVLPKCVPRDEVRKILRVAFQIACRFQGSSPPSLEEAIGRLQEVVGDYGTVTFVPYLDVLSRRRMSYAALAAELLGWIKRFCEVDSSIAASSDDQLPWWYYDFRLVFCRGDASLWWDMDNDDPAYRATAMADIAHIKRHFDQGFKGRDIPRRSEIPEPPATSVMGTQPASDGDSGLSEAPSTDHESNSERDDGSDYGNHDPPPQSVVRHTNGEHRRPLRPTASRQARRPLPAGREPPTNT